MTPVNLSMKQKQTHRYRELEVASGEREVGGARPVSGTEAETARYKVSKLQGYILQHKEIQTLFVVTLNGV